MRFRYKLKANTALWRFKMAFPIDIALENETNLWTYNKNSQSIEFGYKDTIKADYEKVFENLFPNINLDFSTPQGQLITSLVQSDLNAIAYAESFINAFFFGGSGFFLDLWAWNNFRIQRKSGVKSQVTIKVEGISGTQIPLNFKVTDGTHYYLNAFETIIPESGFINLTFEAEKLEDFQAPADTINQIAVSVAGIERVNNPAKATLPVLTETDSVLFQRCLTYGAVGNSSTFKSIMANVAQVEGVSKIGGAENYTSATKVIKNLTLKQNSISIIVKGGTDVDIANAIAETRPTGCGMNGNVDVNLVYNNEKYTYSFYRPKIKELAVSVSIKQSSIINAEYASDIKKIVNEYVSVLDLGAFVSQPEIAQKIRDGVSLVNVVDVKIGLKGVELGYNSIQLNLDEEASIADDDIQILIVV